VPHGLPRHRTSSFETFIINAGLNKPAAAEPEDVLGARLKLRLGILSRSEQGTWSATASIQIEHERERIELLGIRVFEPRDGWIVMDLPTAEEWSPLLATLPEALRNRFDEPEFYERLRTALSRRFLARKAARMEREAIEGKPNQPENHPRDEAAP
jgi:hypothetical protein